MKTLRPQHVVLPFALLSAAFLLGCQEQGLEPAFPDVAPQFNRPIPGEGHNHGDDPTVAGTFSVSTLASDDVEVVKGVLIGPNGGKNNLQNEFGDLVTINLKGFEDLVAGGDQCFKGDSDDGKFDAIMMVSQVTASNIEDAQILFFFDAKGTEGSAVNYGIAVFGTFEKDRPWPPTLGESNTIMGKRFTLAHNNGPGKKDACTGEGDITPEGGDITTGFDFTLKVTRTS